MHEERITIATVNWYSTNFLEPLFGNLNKHAQNAKRLQFLIIDNTQGDDKELKSLEEKFQVTIIQHNPGNIRGSYAHASGLNAIKNYLHTPYFLITDPDIYVLKSNWDSYLIDLLNKSNSIAAGTTYPFWQLGKYHNFPNPVFSFFKTEAYINLNPDWQPFETNRMLCLWDFLRRNVLRLGPLLGRRPLETQVTLRRIWSNLEKVIGVCSKDTGWKLARKAQRHGLRSITLQTVPYPEISKNDPLYALAKDFELYHHNTEPFLAHKYSTCSKLWRTQGGQNSQYWSHCLQKLSGINHAD